jgi:hypothetical protein
MSNNKLIKVTAAAVIGAAGFFTAPAQAAAVSATASFLDMTLSLLTPTNDSYLNDASTPFDSGFSVGSVLQNYDFNTSTPDGTSYAAISDTFAPLPQTTAGAIGNGLGHASVLWTFDWEATATGTASISLDFLSAAILQNLGVGEKAFVRSYGSVLLDGTNLEDSANYFFNTQEGNTGAIETLGLSFAVTAGQRGSFTLALNSDAFAAPVPVPAALPLLGSALLGFGAFVRRRRERAAA